MTRDRISGLVLLALSLGYFFQAFSIELYPGSEADTINARTFPKAIGAAGALIAALIMLLPDKSDAAGERADFAATLRGFDWLRPALLCALMIGYGLSIRTAGFFLSTSVFLLGGYLILGERRWWMLLIAAIPVAAGFEYILAGLLGIHIVDPFLTWIGIMQQ